MRDRRTTVLIVEREALIGNLLAELLTDEGFDVLLAADDRAGLSLAREYLPNAILLDLGLPPGGGFTLIERLRGCSRTRFIPVVALTTAQPVALEQGGFQWTSLVRMPFDLADLLAHIERVVRHGDSGLDGTGRGDTPPPTPTSAAVVDLAASRHLEHLRSQSSVWPDFSGG